MPSKAPKSPCTRECENRSAICHTICVPWLEYEKERNGFYAERLERKEKAKNTYTIKTIRKPQR